MIDAGDDDVGVGVGVGVGGGGGGVGVGGGGVVEDLIEDAVQIAGGERRLPASDKRVAAAVSLGSSSVT